MNNIKPSQILDRADCLNKENPDNGYHKSYIHFVNYFSVRNELSEADVDFPVKTEYKFDINKTYTLAEVWLKDSVAYDKYYKGTAALRKKMGAKIIFKLSPNEYNSLTKGPDSPDFLILIEWPNKQGPEQYAQSEEFKPYKPYIEAGLAKLGWYEVGFPVSNAEVYK